MISLENTKDLFDVKFIKGHINKKDILTKTPIKLKANSIHTVESGIFIDSLSNLDECWFKGGIEDNSYNVIVQSERYNKQEDKQELIFIFYNPTNNIITIPQNISIGRLYYSIMNNNSFNEKELYATNIYNDGDLIIKCLSNGNHNYTINTDSSGKKTLVVDMKD